MPKLAALTANAVNHDYRQASHMKRGFPMVRLGFNPRNCSSRHRPKAPRALQRGKSFTRNKQRRETQKSSELLNAYTRGEESARPFLSRDAAVHPGYVRLVLRWHDGLAHARLACRRFASLCHEENASHGLIVAESSNVMGADFEDVLETATAVVRRGFKLAIVARGSASVRIARTAASIAARRKATAKIFSSEHQAAGWLMS